MPQGDKQEFKTRISAMKEIKKISKELKDIQAQSVEYEDLMGNKSEDLVKSTAELIAKRKQLHKEYKKDKTAAKEGTGAWIKGAEDWGAALDSKVIASLKNAKKEGKSLSKSYVEAQGNVTKMGVDLMKSTKGGMEESAKLVEQFSGINIQIEEMVAGITEFSDDKMAELLEKQKEYNKKLKKAGKLSDDQAKTLDDIVEGSDDIAGSMSEASVKGGKFAEHLTTAKGRANMLAVAISAVGAGMEKVAETAEKMQTNLGTATDHTLKMAFGWKKFGLAMFGLNAGLSSARQDIAIAASDITMMNDESKYLAQNFAWVARNTGASTKTLAEMQEIMMLTTDLSRESANQMIMGLEGFVREAGGIPKEVFDDIASSAEEIAKFTDGSANSIARAATMANKLGINLKTAGSIADSLLNLESSIAAEFEASVLIGRDLNLDKARTLALNNDLEGVMKEIVAQVGSEQEFLAMSAVERQSLAAAVGMSTEDLSKMIGYGADGGGEVDPKLKLQKKGNKTLLDILFQLTPGGFKSLVSMLTKGLVGLLGFKAIKGGVMAALKTAGVDGAAYFKAFKGNISSAFKTWFGKSRLMAPVRWLFGVLKVIKDWIFAPFKFIAKWWSTFKPFTALGTLTGKLMGHFAILKNFLSKSGPLLKFLAPFKAIFSKLSGWLAPLFDLFQTFFGKGAGDTEAGASGLTFGAAGAVIGTFFGPGVGTAIGYAVGSVVGHIVNHFLPSVGKKIVEWANIIGDDFMAALGWVMDIPNKIGALGSIAYDNTIGAGIQIGKDAINAWNESYPVWKADMIQSFKDTWIGLGDSIVATVSELWNSIYQPIEDMGTALIEKAKGVMNFDLAGWAGKKWDETSILPTWLGGDGGKTHEDFVWRSGQGIQKFSKDDNLLGMKDLSMLKQAGSGATSDARLEKQLAILTAINENLAPLAVLVTSNEGIKTAIENNKIVAGD